MEREKFKQFENNTDPPGDFIAKVKQINSQSDLISMSSFADPSYLTIRPFVCIILIWYPCICNLHNLCQTESSYICQKPPQQWALTLPSVTAFYQANSSSSCLLSKGPPKLCIEYHLVPLWAFPLKSHAQWKQQKCKLLQVMGKDMQEY